MKCELKLTEKHEYLETDTMPLPSLPIKIFRGEMRNPIKVRALLDTGFDDALILSRTVGDFIQKTVREPDGYEELYSAGLGIPCDLYQLAVFVGGKWFKINAYLPRAGDLGTIIGRQLLNKLNICLRGRENTFFIAKT